MGYAGYAPGHQVQIATPLQQLLKLIKNDATLATMEKLTRNTAQAPAEEKFRKIRLTNPKIAEIITNVTGAVEAMGPMKAGWNTKDKCAERGLEVKWGTHWCPAVGMECVPDVFGCLRHDLCGNKPVRRVHPIILH